MKPSGAHTHPGGGAGTAALVVGAAVLAAAVAGPVLAAAAELLRIVVITVAVVVGLALAAGIAAAALWLRRRHAIPAAVVSQPRPVPWRATEPLSASRRSAAALPAPGRPEVHLHFHGVSAEDIVEALRQLPGEPGR
jgi:hypothetical protein